MRITKFNVPGMSCEHCKRAITLGLAEVVGINKVDIDLESKIITVEYDENVCSEDEIKESIEDSGYDVA